MTKVTIGGRSYEVEVRGDTVVVDGHDYPITVREETGYSTVNAGGVAYRVQLPAAADRVSGMPVQVDYRQFVLEYEGRIGGGPAPRERKAAASTNGSGAVAYSENSTLATQAVFYGSQAGSPQLPNDGPFDDLHEAMRIDKKARGSQLRFVVLDDLARPRILAGPSDDDLRASYAAIASGA